MLKKSLLPPARPRRAKTRPFPCVVLASLRGSTYRSVRLASSLAAALPAERRVSARRGWAGEKSGLFEHPARRSPLLLNVRAIEFPPRHNSFSAASWWGYCWSLSGIDLRHEAKKALADARPQAPKNRRRIRWNTLRRF